jgi:hypothetical protein
MTRTATIAALTAAANLTAARAALKAADAYQGCSRYNREQMLARCAEVAADLQAAQDADDKAAADKADADKAAADTTPRCAMTARKLSAKQQGNHDQLQAAVDAGVATDDGVVIDTATWLAHTSDSRLGAYQRTSWTDGDGDKAQPATWNPYYMAALRMGYGVTWAGDKARTGTLTVVALDDDAAQAARDAHVATVATYKASRAARKAARPADYVAPSVVNARTQPVNARTVGKLQALVADATVTDGAIVVTGDDLALAGLPASWARTPNAHLADAAHVKARTLAALDLQGHTSRGTLTLTALVAADAADKATA